MMNGQVQSRRGGARPGAGRKRMADDERPGRAVVLLRCSWELSEALKREAAASGRSLSKEAAYRLQYTIDQGMKFTIKVSSKVERS